MKTRKMKASLWAVLPAFFVAFGIVTAAPALAQTEGRVEAVDNTGANRADVAISPYVGILGYQDAQGDYTSRMLEGALLRLNGSELLGTGAAYMVGFEVGLLYSHLGAAGSNYFGADSPAGSAGAGANAFFIPYNVVGGYHLTDDLLLSAQAGGQLLYRSIANQMQVGRDDLAADDSWDVFPNVGLNLGWDVSPSVALNLRGDYIPTSADDIVTGTLGATIGL